MPHPFDSFAKTVSGAMSRREAFSKVGGGLALGILAFIGLGASKASECAQACVQCCQLHNFPPRNDDSFGESYGECVSRCHQGEGTCGPLVCPGGLNG